MLNEKNSTPPAISFDDLFRVCQRTLAFIDGALRACYEIEGYSNQAVGFPA
jgi:hypothetical protein